ncbi:MAG: cation transporter [Lachnospiraceae bacterium]|nr:cation transporter [Lachnospiraceae bacterium]
MMKKNRKRLMAALMCAAILTTAAIPAYASSTDQQSMELTMSKDATFIMTIPSTTNTVVFGAVDTEIGEVKVTGDVGTKQQVEVTVTKTDFVDEKDSTNTFAFSLQYNDADFTGAIWSTEELRNETKALSLTVHIPTATWEGTTAGTYKATLTFQAELQDIE